MEQQVTNRGAMGLRLLRAMLECRIMEEITSRIRADGEVLGNTFPSLGQEATCAIGMALRGDDAVFPSYRSRPVVIGCGVGIEAHLRELFGSPDSLLAGREVFHHAYWPAQRVMPASSMIGGWVPMATGYAHTLKLEGRDGVAVCVMGDGSFGSGDLHESLNIVGVWKLPFVLAVENNGYQVSGQWSDMRHSKSLEPHIAPYGFVTRSVDGNDAFAVLDAMDWAREKALAGQPAMIDCHTYRMGGYSSHLGEPRKGHEAELAEWREKDPIDALRRRLANDGTLSDAAYKQLEATIRDEADGALARVRASVAGAA
jgi:TPP-dependent pyruvate/acetoin dehydrogenase alpha subunit